MPDLPALIQRRDADIIMGQPLYSQLATHVPHIRVPGRRLFPANYIVALAGYKPQWLRLAERVRYFAQTDLAHQLQTTAIRRTTQVLDSATELTTTQLAELLCVSRETIANWYETDVIPVNRGTRHVPQRQPHREPRTFITVRTADLRRIIVWHLPNVTR